MLKEKDKGRSRGKKETTEELLQAILDSTPISVYCKDKDGRLLYCSKGYYKQYEENYGKRYGLKLPEDLIGKSDFDLFLKEHAEQMFEDDRRVTETGESIVGKVEHFTGLDGTEQNTLTTKIPRFDKKGNIIGLVGISQDLTERMELKRELTYERSLFKNLMDNLPLSVYFKDKQGRLLRVSSHFSKLTPSTAPVAGSMEEVIGKTDFDLFPEWLAKAAAEDEKRIMETRQPVIEKEERFVTPDGHEIYLSSTKAPLLDAEGKVMGIVGITHDITERKRAEETLQRAAVQILEAVSIIVEANDPYTAGHSSIVTNLALKIAGEMRLDDKQLETLRVAGLLHDLGEVGITSSVLHKPAKLTQAEWVMIEAHPVISAETTERVAAFKDAIPVIRHHHERWDGEGYPNKLTGEEIPFLARILAVADAFDAMTSERPYRRTRTTEEALRELEKNAGTQWDPAIVKVLLKLERSLTKPKGADLT